MRRALIVGIDDYPKAPLTGCVNDATAIAGLVEAHGDDGSPNFAVRLLRGRSASGGFGEIRGSSQRGLSRRRGTHPRRAAAGDPPGARGRLTYFR